MSPKKNTNGQSPVIPAPPGPPPDMLRWLIPFAESASDFVWILDAETKQVVYANSSFERIFGRPVEIFRADYHQTLDFVHPEDVLAAKGRAEPMSGQTDRTYRILRPDGEVRWLNTQIYQLKDDAGEVRMIGGITRDITLLQQAKQNLIDSERRYLMLADNAPVGILETDRDEVVVYVNPRWCELAGVEAQQVLGRTSSHFYHPEDRDRVMEAWRRALRTGSRIHLEYRFQRPDQSIVWVSAAGTPLFSVTGEVTGYLRTLTDITAEKEARLALEDRERRYRQLLETASDVVVATDLDGRFTYANPAAERLTGFSLDQLTGKRFVDLIAPHDSVRVTRLIAQQIATRTPETLRDYPIITANGDERWIEQTITLVMDGDEVIGLQGIGRDATARKLAEDALFHEQEMMQALMENTPDMIYFKDAESRFTRINPAQARLLSISSPDLAVGRTDADFQSEQIARDALAEERRIIATGELVVDRTEFNPLPDGTPRWLSNTKVPIRNKDGVVIGIAGISRDITERRQSVEALRQSEAARKAILDAMPDLIFRLDRNGVYLDFHAPDPSRLPVPPEQFVGRTVREMLPPDFAGRVLSLVDRVFSSGHPVVAENPDPFNPGMMREVRIVQSGPDEVLLIVRDVTERKKAEEALRRSEAARKAILNAIPDMMFRVSRGGEVLDAHIPDPAFELIKPETVRGQAISQMLPPELVGQALASLEKAFETSQMQILDITDALGLGLVFETRTVVSNPDEALVLVRDITERKRSEEALRASEAARAAILDAIPDVMFRVSRGGIILDHHAPPNSRLSMPSERYIGRHISAIVPPESASEALGKIASVLSNGGVETLEFHAAPGAKSEAAVVEIRFIASGPEEVLVIARDITEQEQAQEALSRSEAARKAILDAMPDIIMLVSGDGTIKEVHMPESVAASLPAEMLPGHSFDEITAPDAARQAIGAIRRVLSSGETLVFEAHDSPGSETIRETRIIASGPDTVLFVVRDITERKKTEEALTRSEAAREAMLQALPDVMFRVNRQGVYLDMHAPGVHNLPIPEQEFIGKSIREVMPRDYADELMEKLEQAFRRPGEVVIYESPDPLDQGVFRERRILVSGPNEALLIVRDITEARRAQDGLRDSEMRFRKLFELSPDAIVLLDPHDQSGHWVIIDCNEIACEMNGYDREEMLGRDIDILHEHPTPRDERLAYMERLRKEGAFRGEAIHVRKDGSRFPMMYSTSLITIGDRELILGIDRDITERREAEEALQRSEERFRQLTERAPVGIFETNVDGHITYVNPRWTLLTGRTLDEVRDRQGLTRTLHPDDRARVIDAWSRVLKDRSEFYMEYRYERPHGEVVWVVCSATPLRDKDNEFIGYLGTVVDITHRKRAEEAEQEQRALAEALRETSATVNSTLNLDDVLSHILEKLGSVVPHEAANIMLVENGNLRVVSYRGYTKRGQARQVSRIDVPLDQVPVMKTAYDRQEGILIPDVRRDPRWIHLRADQGVRSYASAPIIGDGRVLGFLNLDSATPGYFTPNHLHRLQAFADQVAFALRNAQIYRLAQQEIEERKRAEQAEQAQRALAEALRDTASAINSTLDLDSVLRQLLEKLGSVVPHEAANIMLAESGRLRIASYHGYGLTNVTGQKLSEGMFFEVTPLLREAGQTRQPVLVSDTSADTRWVKHINSRVNSYVVAPIVRNDEVMGFLNLDSDVPGFFTEQHILPLKAFAEQAAIALHNARVYEHAQQEIADRKRAEEALWQQNDYLAGLHEVTLGLVQQVDQETRLRTVVSRAATLLNAQDAFLAVVEPSEGRMRMAFAVGRYASAIGSFTLPGEGQAGIAWETGRSQMTPDYQSMPGKRADRPWLRAAISTPLKIGSEVIGVLEAGFDHPVDLDLERVFYLERFAELAALTFHNGRLYELAQQEIVDRKRAEQALELERDFARQVMDALGQGLTVTDRQDRIVYANPAFVQLTHHSLEELIGTPPSELVVPEDTLIVMAHSVSRFDGISDSYEVTLQRGDGSRVPVLVTGTPRTEGSEVTGSIAVVTDLTRQKKNEESLARQAAELSALYKASGGLIQAGRTPADLATDLNREMAQELEATHVSVWMLSPDGKALELAGQAYEPFPEDHRSYPLDGPGLLVEAFRSGQQIYAADVREDARYVEVLPGTLSKLVIPLRAEGQIVGVFTVESERPQAFDEASRRLFSVFAEQVGLALENMQLIDRLNSATQTAIEANQAKSDFLANMSHEIRTPLNGVLGIIELVLGTELNKQQRDDLSIAQQSAESLLGLINDILDLSKIEAGRLEFEEVDFDLNELIDQTMQIMVPRLKAGVALEKNLAPRMPSALRGDPIRLRQILINLVGNAAKFTSKGSVSLDITVEKRTKDNVMLHFAVRDTGIGIPSDKIKAIFDPFTQVDSSTTRKFGGTGLGLTIVQRLVDKFGGTIWVESQLGTGSTFHFTARLGRAEAPIAHRRRSPTRPARAQALGQLNVLVAEDNRVNQHVMSGMLSKRGWNVSIAADGNQAAEKALSERFDVILMDVQMPGMDGFQVTALIRKQESAAGGHTPIIALTAHAMQGDRERCIAAGMDDYLSKPVKMDELYATIENVMAGRKSTKRNASTGEEALAIFDRTEALHYIADDVGLLREVLIIFRQEWPTDMAYIETAAEAGDMQTLALVSHRLKGQTGVLGGQQARARALALEQLSKTGDLEGARKAIPPLRAALKALDTAVSAELATDPPADPS